MMSEDSAVEILKTEHGIDVYHMGPPLDEGPLPTVVYFALSGEQSLTLDPFNQPMACLKDKRIRKFSFTLPYHGPEFVITEAMRHWASDLAKGNDIITPFIDDVVSAIDEMISKGYINKGLLAVAGLSRGGFIACHVAARNEHIRTILGFAPLTQFGLMTEFQDTIPPPLVEQLSLMNIIDDLVGKHLRFYIGNRDLRVGTRQCFEFINALTEASFAKKHRSPPVELIITPSIGHKGHGTGPNTFKDGAEWIHNRLAGE